MTNERSEAGGPPSHGSVARFSQISMNILFVVPYTPNLIRTRPYNFIHSLVKRGHVVTVATLWENWQERESLSDLEQQGIEVVATQLTRIRSVKNVLRILPTHTPLQAVFCWHPELLRLIHEQLSQKHFDVIHVEHLRGSQYGLALKESIAATQARPALVWDSVDCISHLFEQATRTSRSLFGKFVARLELGRTRSYEKWLVTQFDAILVTSGIDKNAFENLALQDGSSKSAHTHARSITVVPNGVDLEFFAPLDYPRHPETIVFSGKMSYHANVTAALYLVYEVMPHVWAQKPNVRVQIVGHQPPRQLQNLARAFAGRVEVTGTVPDLRPYLAKATIAVAPILYGAGIQNKVLEGMAMATPVVATSQAVSAIPVQNGEQLLVADTPQGFAQHIIQLIDDPSRRDRLARQGRQYVEANHDWNRITDKLERTYLKTLATLRVA